MGLKLIDEKIKEVEVYTDVFKNKYPPISAKILALLYVFGEKELSVSEISSFFKIHARQIRKYIRILQLENEVSFCLKHIGGKQKRVRFYYLDIESKIAKINSKIEYYNLLNMLYLKRIKENDFCNKEREAYMKNMFAYRKQIIRFMDTLYDNIF